MNVTRREIEYLEALEKLSGGENIFIGTTELARDLGISPASAVDVLESLCKKGYILYIKRLGSRLTEKGRCLLNKLIWKHRVIETLIYNVVGGDLSSICNGIRGVELVINDEVVLRIYNKLGRPAHCPHGYKIPAIESA